MFLHDRFVYGPVTSRRLGRSLGINLLPVRRKVCNFECIYCECGWTDKTVKDELPSRNAIAHEVESRLAQSAIGSEMIDHITFAGNGEPTLHPDFSEIINDTIQLRDRLAPTARIAVLSNGVRAGDPPIFQALRRIDDAIMKVDAGTEDMFRAVDLPPAGVTLDQITESFKAFQGDLVIQTLFLQGEFSGRWIDNSVPDEVRAWIERLRQIRPRRVMIYTVDRLPAAEGLRALSTERLADIARQVNAVGIQADYYG